MFRALLDRLSPPDRLRVPLRQARCVVIDTELTGLDVEKDRIISVGAVRLDGEALVLGEMFYELIDPRRALEAKNVLIHRLTPAQLAGRPEIAEVGRRLIEFCEDRILVGFAAGIDLRFLRRGLADGPWRRERMLCTGAAARWLEQHATAEKAAAGARGRGGDLFQLARALGVPVNQPHDALHDAYLTAQVWQRQLREFERHGFERPCDLPASVWVA